jgi:endonuclease IV
MKLLPRQMGPQQETNLGRSIVSTENHEETNLLAFEAYKITTIPIILESPEPSPLDIVIGGATLDSRTSYD